MKPTIYKIQHLYCLAYGSIGSYYLLGIHKGIASEVTIGSTRFVVFNVIHASTIIDDILEKYESVTIEKSKAENW